MKKQTLWFNILLAILIVMANVIPAAAEPVSNDPPPVQESKNLYEMEAQDAVPETPPVSKNTPKQLGGDLEPVLVEATDVIDMNEVVYYIVQLEDVPLALYEGGIAGLAPTSIKAQGTDKLDVSTAASVAYLNHLKSKQAEFVADAEKLLAREAQVYTQYRVVYNGVAMQMNAYEAAEVAEMPGVKRVIREFNRYPVTDAGPAWIGAEGIWDGSATGTPYKGEGIVIGVIDTGINLDHPSFADIGGDGYDHTNPLGAGNYLGLCDSDPSTYVCNDKLIGGYDYADALTDDPNDGMEDSNGHGSHTASTAGGNVLEDLNIVFATTSITTSISGVAPHANIIMYDTCGDDDGCPNVATLAAIEQATIDQVDVINYSIGGGPSSPWGDSDAEAYLAARYAGVFVATSAANDGPGAGTIGSPANAPWLTTVGNATHNRTYTTTMSFTGGDSVLADMEGTSITGPYGPASIVHAGDYGDPLCGSAFAAGTWTNGEIVVCDRGDYALVDKVDNVLAGGAGGAVIANAAFNGPQTYAIAHSLPSAHVNYVDAEALRTWLSSGSGHMATIAESVRAVDDTFGDRMSTSSSRGPNLPVPDVIKPDVISPGSDILAAYKTPIEYASIGGTSMASPHTAGAGALLSQIYPDWTESQRQSALMLTANSSQVMKEDWVTPGDPFDYGAGRVNVSAAALVGFVLDETEANFTNADPLNGGDPATLNLASLGQDECLNTCSWTRTISSTLPYTVTWTASTTGLDLTVTPSTFDLGPFETLVLTIDADASALPVGVWDFGEVGLTGATTGDPVPPDAHFSVAIQPTTGVLPDLVDIDARRDAGSKIVEDLSGIEITDLTIETYGLVSPTLHEYSLPEITDNSVDFPDIFFQGGPGIEFTELTVPAGSMRLLAEILETTSPDLDMLVFRDIDDDGTPELTDVDDESCQSAAGGPYESCDILDPTPGRWFVSVINFTESEETPDDVVLGTAVVSTDAGNMLVTGPSAVPAGESFDLQVFWDEAAMMVGETWYGVFSLGTDAGNPGNLGMIPVNVNRLENDIVKTANTDVAFYGDTVDFTITVNPNDWTDGTLSYMLTDTIPSGLTYVPGSLQATEGVAAENAGTITWSGDMYQAGYTYLVSDNATDPSCATPWGGYQDALTAHGYDTDPGLSGDERYWNYGGFFGTMDFYDALDIPEPVFTADGYATFSADFGAVPNQSLPDATLPNNILAPYWRDLEIVYDAATNKGVTAVSYGVLWLLEFDDIEPYPAGSTGTSLDFEILMWNDVDPAAGGPDIMFAYDNVTIADTVGTIGVENSDGTLGSEYAYNDFTPYSGLVVCFDYAPVGDPIEITYQATVDAMIPGSPIVNEVLHSVDLEGSAEESSTFDLYVLGGGEKAASSTLVDPGDLLTYTITLEAGPTAEMWDVTDTIPDGFTFVNVAGATYDAGTNSINWTGGLGSGETIVAESFEGAFPPTGWTTYDIDGGDQAWEQSSTTANTGTFAARHRWGGSTAGMQDAWLVTPQFSVPAGGGDISFWQNVDYVSDMYKHSMSICTTVCDSPPTNYTEIADFDSPTEDTWEERVVNLDAYANQDVYVGFHYEGDYAATWYVDDVSYPDTVAYPDSHVITLTLEGATPGFYVNVAEVTSQGMTGELAAPEVRVYGPIVEWEKELTINGMSYALDAGPYTVVEGDIVEVVDSVSINDYTGPISFTLTEEWTDSLMLTEYGMDDGMVTVGSNTLDWALTSGISNTWYVLTKTFEVTDDYGFYDILTETLVVEEGVPIPEVVLEFEIPGRLTKNGPATAHVDDVITYEIVIETAGALETTLAELSDALPTGVEFAGNLNATAGTAWYSATTDTVYWNYTAPTPTVLHDQPDEGSGSGLVSDFYLDVGLGAYTADDFTNVTAWDLGYIYVEGFNNDNGLLEAEALNWYIYADVGGSPAGHPGDGNEVWSHTCAPTAPEVTIVDGDDIPLLDVALANDGMPLNLPAGTYWMTFFPSIDVTTYNRWNWTRTNTAYGAVAQLYDEGIFGGFDWTPVNALVADHRDYVFTLSDGVEIPTTITVTFDVTVTQESTLLIDGVINKAHLEIDGAVIEAEHTLERITWFDIFLPLVVRNY